MLVSVTFVSSVLILLITTFELYFQSSGLSEMSLPTILSALTKKRKSKSRSITNDVELDDGSFRQTSRSRTLINSLFLRNHPDSEPNVDTKGTNGAVTDDSVSNPVLNPPPHRISVQTDAGGVSINPVLNPLAHRISVQTDGNIDGAVPIT